MQCSAAGRIGGFKAQSSGRSWVSLAHDVRTKAMVRLRAEARVRVRVWIRVGIRVRVRFGARVRVSKLSSDDPGIELRLMVVRARWLGLGFGYNKSARRMPVTFYSYWLVVA